MSQAPFGYELDLEHLTKEEKELAKKQILEYKKMERLVQTGDYYRLSNPFHNDDYVIWQFVSKDQKETIVNGVQLRNEPNPHIHLIYPEGLLAEGHYKDLATGAVYTGAALMHAGIPLPVGEGDYQPIQFHFQMME